MSFREEKTFFGRLSEHIGDVLMARAKVDDELLDELEETLIMGDIGMDTTVKAIEQLRDDVKKRDIRTTEAVAERLKSILEGLVDKGDRCRVTDERPLIILMIGINGGGKTTTIGKLTYYFKDRGERVLLAAGDTFRAAAGEQLALWGDRMGVNVIRHREGADPCAVIYDGIQSAKAKDIDVLICDTAGRLQNKKNLMAELEKMHRIIGREYPDAALETLLVLDGTTGKNAVSQVKEFGEITDLSGVVITKLDGTAKGGIAITIADEYDMPIKFIGVGERPEDLREFDPKEFVGQIFEESGV